MIKRFCCLDDKNKKKLKNQTRWEELIQFELVEISSKTKKYKSISSH